MKSISIFLGLVLIVAFGKGEQPTAPFYTLIGVTGGNARVNSEFTLTFSLKALMDVPMSLVIYEIPKGVEWTGGNLVDTIYPRQGDSITVSARLRITKPGPYCITCHTIIAPVDTISRNSGSNLYILH